MGRSVAVNENLPRIEFAVLSPEDVAAGDLCLGGVSLHRRQGALRSRQDCDVTLPQLQILFVYVMTLVRVTEILRLGAVASDGTKVHAHASRGSGLAYGLVKKIEKRPTGAVQGKTR